MEEDKKRSIDDILNSIQQNNMKIESMNSSLDDLEETLKPVTPQVLKEEKNEPDIITMASLENDFGSKEPIIEKDNHNEAYEILKKANSSIKEATDLFEENIKLRNDLDRDKEKLAREKKEFDEKVASEYKKIEEANREKEELLNSREQQLENAKKDLNKQIEQLQKDYDQYLKEKDELANNLDKFNDLVADFYGGLNKVNQEG